MLSTLPSYDRPNFFFKFKLCDLGNDLYGQRSGGYSRLSSYYHTRAGSASAALPTTIRSSQSVVPVCPILFATFDAILLARSVNQNCLQI